MGRFVGEIERLRIVAEGEDSTQEERDAWVLARSRAGLFTCHSCQGGIESVDQMGAPFGCFCPQELERPRVDPRSIYDTEDKYVPDYRYVVPDGH